MFALFRRRQRATELQRETAVHDTAGFLRPASAAELMDTPRRRLLLQHIWQRTSLSRIQFDELYRAPLDRYALLVQQFPASENHHHAYAGGMLDHGLEIVAYALKLRQSYLLPVGAAPETQAAQAEAWTAAAAYAALLHDLGKIAVDLQVEDDTGASWHPWHGPLTRAYRFRYRKDREYRLHGAAVGLLYTRILDEHILDWLSGFPDLWSALLYVLSGQYERAGVLGELVIKADQASVAQALGGDPSSAQSAPRHSLQRKLLEGLRFLLKEQLKLNQPTASDGWLTQDALWLVSKTVCDKLRAHLLAHGIDGVPSRNSALFDVLQEHGIVNAAPDGNAIWRATVTSDSGWSHTFTFLHVSPALIWETDERPAPFNGTVRAEGSERSSDPDPTELSNVSGPTPSAAAASRQGPLPSTLASADDAVTSVLALLEGDDRDARESSTAAIDAVKLVAPMPNDANAVEPARVEASPHGESIGEHFVAWLRDRIRARHLIINDAKALVHTVTGTAYLVSPGIFQRFIQEHPDVARCARQESAREWEWVQKQFERLKIHRKRDNGLNIWTCEVVGPRRTRRLHGYLLIDGETVFADIPTDNPYLKLLAPETAAPSHINRD